MPKTLFDHLNEIFQRQTITYWDTLSDVDKKSYNQYMINRFISMNMDYVLVVDELQKHWDQISSRESYLFFSQILPKKKQFNKYVKPIHEDDSYEEWLVNLICNKYSICKREATDYLKIFYVSDAGRVRLKSIVEDYGVAKKLIKKAGL